MQRTRRDIEVSLIERAREDESFKQKLLRDPRAALEQELGIRLPAGVELKVVEETPQTRYLVLPQAPEAFWSRLSEEELEDLAGGFCWGMLHLAFDHPH